VIILFFNFVFAMAAAQQVHVAPPLPQVQEVVKPQALSVPEISELRTKAEAGNAIAQTALGNAYRTGNGVPHSDEIAARWFRRAADQGNADAENSLGIMYGMGEGVERNKEEAVRWYRKAAKQGSGKAMFNLGAAYYNGDGVAVDDVSSCAWFLLAQEAGFVGADEAVRRAASESAATLPQASENVGEMYELGEEVPKSASSALKWHRRAADGGSLEAAVKAAALLVTSPSATQEEYAEARKRCADAANMRYAPADYCMAIIYRRGIGVVTDPVEAAKWLARAANLRHPGAILQLGEAYWKGDGVKRDLITGYSWIWIAYNLKVPGAEKDEEGLRQQLSSKDIDKAKKKADIWVLQHHFVVLRQMPGDGTSPSH
jgi:TPR repeat protein